MSIKKQVEVFVGFQKSMAAVFATIPLILRFTDDTGAFRDSISDYVYMPHSYVFGMLLGAAAMMFIFNGALYFVTQDTLDISTKGKWYNVILGLLLLGVICTPHKQYSYIHYPVSIAFFVGNAIVTAIFHNKRDRVISIILASLTAGVFAFSYANVITVFWAEWASLVCISIHFIMQSNVDTI
jgi:MFS family permease